MKKILFSLLALFALVSCSDKNDDTPITYTPEEAKASVQNAMDSFYDCLKKQTMVVLPISSTRQCSKN